MRPSTRYTVLPSSLLLPGLLSLGMVMAGCHGRASGDAGGPPLFDLMPPARTGIYFNNTVMPTDSLNLLTYEYLYNGGGVGVGDFNGDGRPDLVFTGNMVESKLYLNEGDLRFTELPADAGFTTAGKWCTGVSVVDINSDGYDDLYVTVGGPARRSIYPNLLFVNQGDATFREAAADYGLADPSETNHAVFLDYDRDGDLDVYLLNGGGFERSAVTLKPILDDGSARNTDALYENTYSDSLGHAVFTNVSRAAGTTYEGFGLGVAVIDANHDDWPDLYVSNDYLSRDLLYLNNQDGTFREAADQYFGHTSFFSMGNAVGDLNNDGYFDLVTLDMLPEDHFRRMTMFGPNQHGRFEQAVGLGYGYQYMRNMLQLGGAARGFREVGQIAGIDRTDWSWCPLLADLDNDGRQDLYVTNGYGKNITDLDFVKFRQSAVDPFSQPEDATKVLHESLDALPAIVLPNYAFRNGGDLTFTATAKPWGLATPSISHGAVAVDLDQDGDMEIVTNNLDAPAFVYRSLLRERHPATANYLKVELRGPDANRHGAGARVVAYSGANQQHRYQQPAGGYQSSQPVTLHFGLGLDTLVDSLRVLWPDGQESVVYDLPANRSVTVDYSTAGLAARPLGKPAPLLRAAAPLPFRHREAISPSDFAVQPLLPHAFTHQGPGIAVGDVNGDGREDLFLGGGYGSDASILVHTKEGSFAPQPLGSEPYEDLGGLLLDIDGDRDLDLYVSSGGTERHAGSAYYQDRLYRNDGAGHFTLDEGALPTMISSTAAVTAGDYDRDGAIDLFVGGRVVPGQYPAAPRSYLLRNTGRGFTDVTASVCPELEEVGMVTSAVWTDYNDDQLPDLIVVGEMMNIRAFQNDGKRLIEVSDLVGLSHSSGMWNSLTPGDFDDDGDTDYVVGNLGENTPHSPTPGYPLQLHYGDFDANGTTDPILSVYEAGHYYPAAPFDQLTAQLPRIKKNILFYAAYAKATTSDILALLDTAGMQTLTCELQSSILLENRGKDGFAIRPLPREAQYAPVLGVVAEDVDGNGYLDLLLVGNDYHREVIGGRLDASVGTVLLNDGHLNFTALPAEHSGLLTTGDTRAAVRVAGATEDLLLVTTNAGPLQAFRLPGTGRWAHFEPGEVTARLHFTDGRDRKVENTRGLGYLSQGSATIPLPPQVETITFFDARGNATRSLTPNPADQPQ